MSKLSKSILQKMLKETIIWSPVKTMFERRSFKPYGAFCPNCGETKYISSWNRTSYPDHWEYFICIRCKKIVGYIDNSPFIHALECKHNDYDPTF